MARIISPGRARPARNLGGGGGTKMFAPTQQERGEAHARARERGRERERERERDGLYALHVVERNSTATHYHTLPPTATQRCNMPQRTATHADEHTNNVQHVASDTHTHTHTHTHTLPREFVPIVTGTPHPTATHAHSLSHANPSPSSKRASTPQVLVVSPHRKQREL